MTRTVLASPADLVAAVPLLVGCEPADGMVMAGVQERELVCAARGTLPPADSRLLEVVADAYVARMRDYDVTTVAILGYGPAIQVDPPIQVLHQAVDRCGLWVKDVLRVHAGRWWSYLCCDPACCPPEGTPLAQAGQRR